MPDEESLSREVEEARDALIYGYTEDGWEVPVIQRDLDRLVAAVRKQERAPLVAALRDTAVRFWKDERGFSYLRCDMCGAETDHVGAVINFSKAGHARDCVLAAPVEGGEG